MTEPTVMDIPPLPEALPPAITQERFVPAPGSSILEAMADMHGIPRPEIAVPVIAPIRSAPSTAPTVEPPVVELPAHVVPIPELPWEYSKVLLALLAAELNVNAADLEAALRKLVP